LSLLQFLAIGVAGSIGALARFQLDAAVTLRSDTSFPAGTFVVNISGAFLLGFLTGLAVPFELQRFFAVGILGSFTTFSTWMLETQHLAEAGRPRLAGLNIALSLAVGILAVWLGRELGGLL